MKQYEYDVIPSSRHLTGEFLSVKGEQGWELVSHTYMPDIVVAHIYTFKREAVEKKVDLTVAATVDFLDKEQSKFEKILEREMKAFAKKVGWGVKEDTMQELLNEYNKPETRERLTGLRDQENMFWENPILYAKLENMIMEWSNDETKTAGELTRSILKLIK